MVARVKMAATIVWAKPSLFLCVLHIMSSWLFSTTTCTYSWWRIKSSYHCLYFYPLFSLSINLVFKSILILIYNFAVILISGLFSLSLSLISFLSLVPLKFVLSKLKFGKLGNVCSLKKTEKYSFPKSWSDQIAQENRVSQLYVPWAE